MTAVANNKRLESVVKSTGVEVKMVKAVAVPHALKQMERQDMDNREDRGVLRIDGSW